MADFMLLCQPYHLGGDMFAFICRFRDENTLTKLVEQISAVGVETFRCDMATTMTKSKLYFPRTCAMYSESQDSAALLQSYYQVKEMENHISDRRFEDVKQSNEQALKNQREKHCDEYGFPTMDKQITHDVVIEHEDKLCKIQKCTHKWSKLVIK